MTPAIITMNAATRMTGAHAHRRSRPRARHFVTNCDFFPGASESIARQKGFDAVLHVMLTVTARADPDHHQRSCVVGMMAMEAFRGDAAPAARRRLRDTTRTEFLAKDPPCFTDLCGRRMFDDVCHV